MVVSVSVGYVWELSRLGWHVLGMCQDAGVGGGEARPPRDDNFELATHCYGADRRGGVAGAEPPHRTAVVSG